MSKYLEFKQIVYEGKTKRFEVISKSKGDLLGRIMWYGAWRQYIFSPSYPTIWNKNCLNDIEKFLQELMDERKWQKYCKEWFDKDGKCLKCGEQGIFAEGIGYYCPNKSCKE